MNDKIGVVLMFGRDVFRRFYIDIQMDVHMHTSVDMYICMCGVSPFNWPFQKRLGTHRSLLEDDKHMH